MSQIRTDPLTGQAVIIATNRARRPHEYQRRAVRGKDIVCPFCAGHEQDTPEAIVCYQDWEPGPPTSDWQLRVIPNLYPAVARENPPDKGNVPRATTEADPPFHAQPGSGVHEVIVEARDHLVSFGELSQQQAHRTMLAFRDRLRFHGSTSRYRYGQLFKNVGPEAGASIEHTHSQLMVLPYVPVLVTHLLDRCQQHYHSHSRCLMCWLIESESRLRQRVVWQSDHLIAFCPFAARFPYETWIAPKKHASHFETMPLAALGEVASMLRLVVISLEKCIVNPAYNFSIRTAPFDTHYRPDYHWHIELFPRLTNLAGFEFATGCYINPVDPESAAGQLRAAAGELVRSEKYFD